MCLMKYGTCITGVTGQEVLFQVIIARACRRLLLWYLFGVQGLLIPSWSQAIGQISIES